MPTELDAPLRAVAEALLDECPPVRLHELGLAAAQPTRHRGRILVGIAAAVVAAAFGVSRLIGGDGRVVTLDVPDTTAVTSVTTVATSAPTITDTLALNDQGDEVKALQQRLTDLHFDPGPVDGYFGQATQQAVWAYEKLVLGVPVGESTGAVTPEMWQRMQADPGITARRPTVEGTHVEIYLPEQVLVVFRGVTPELVTHMSSGSGEVFTEQMTIDPGTDENPGTEPIQKVITGTSVTPGGVYTVKRFYDQGDGWRQDALGRMYKPVYFNDGIAVHGSANVPDQPASHGAVRIPMHIAQYFGSLVHQGDFVYVFDGQEEPEKYGTQPPPFDTEVQYVIVPDVSAMSLDDALVALQEAGLLGAPEEAALPAGDSRDGLVIAQIPASGTGVSRGTTVHLSIGRSSSSG